MHWGWRAIVGICLAEIIHVRLVLFTFELVMLPAEINVKGSMTHFPFVVLGMKTGGLCM